MKIFARKTTISPISQAVDTLVSQLAQGVHSDKTLFIRGRLPEIFEVAGKEEQKRVDETKVKTAEVEDINQEIVILNQKQKEVDREVIILEQKQKDIIQGIASLNQRTKDLGDWQRLSNSQSNLGKKKIISLLKYLEPRKIEPGKEIAYLVAFSEGANSEYLKAFLA